MRGEQESIIVVGAGIAGLSAAIALNAAGLPVTLLESSDTCGGKVREYRHSSVSLDVGPTVFTMPWVFDELLESAGSSLGQAIDLEPLDILAHHRWPDGSHFDLYADHARTLEAIGDFAGANAARQYEAFCKTSSRIYDTLNDTFLRRPQPGLLGLLRNAGIARLPALARLSPFTSLWDALNSQFDDRRLCQLFARYATYCGSSPFAAPATLMLIAHVERLGVFSIRGGMRALATALQQVAEQLGTRCEFGHQVTRIEASSGQVEAVVCENGERIEARRVIVCGDKNAVATGEYGADVRSALAPTPVNRRSLSAWTWAGKARVDPDHRSVHNVLFCGDYPAEFRQIFGHGRVPEEPTVYAHLPDASDRRPEQGVFVLINAPANGDSADGGARPSRSTIRIIEERLADTGVALLNGLDALEATGPDEFAERYPATGGALYGEATHGWRAAFDRPGNRTGIRGLYLAGGSIHPGPGVPMAALSGRLAAACVVDDTPGRNTVSGGRI